MIYVIWIESTITDHQIFTLKEFSRLKGVNLQVIALKDELSVRKKQGWRKADLSTVNGKIINTPVLFSLFKLVNKNKDATLIFGGPFDNWVITLFLILNLLFGRRVYILTEPFSPLKLGYFKDKIINKFGFVSKLRWFKHFVLWSVIKNQINGVFAISKLSAFQLKKFGLDKEKIYPFGYFVPRMINDELQTSREQSEYLRFVFVGSINKTKGIDLAVAAIAKLHNSGFKISLDIYGPGDINSFNLSNNISYKGLIEFGRSQEVISNYDCLLLPSRYDGWGVVVNESLLAGVPVICSKQVGASVLLEKMDCGAVFDINIKNSIENVLILLCKDRGVIKKWHKNIIDINKIITPNCAAQYIYDVLLSSLDKETNPIINLYR